MKDQDLSFSFLQILSLYSRNSGPSSRFYRGSHESVQSTQLKKTDLPQLLNPQCLTILRGGQ